MSDVKLEQRARESSEAYNRSDWAAVRDMVHPDYVYDETGTGQHLVGPDAIVAGLQAWKQAMPDSYAEIMGIVVDGDTAVLNLVWRGTHTGPLQTAMGVLPATGKSYEVWGCRWQTWEDGKLRRERHHLDVLSMLTQLGLMPTGA